LLGEVKSRKEQTTIAKRIHGQLQFIREEGGEGEGEVKEIE